MQILPNHYYIVVMKVKEMERDGRCFGLVVQELSSEESLLAATASEEGEKQPTHCFAFHDPQQLRSYVGWIKEDTEERLVFDIGGGKEYEFRPVPSPHEPADPGKIGRN